MELFVEVFDEIHQRIKAAMTAKDRLELRNAAHAGKGASQNSGADQLAAVLQSIEGKAASAPLKELKSLVSQIAPDFDRVRRFVSAFFPQNI
jgi:HPt (histidine-containing phosphotransfer) domain-containing protein